MPTQTAPERTRRTKKPSRYFPEAEFQERRDRVRRSMAEHGLDACLVASPENIYYLCGLDHMGYFAYQMLVLPLDGEPILITRAMERATVADQVPDVHHIGYSDGVAPLPPAQDRRSDLEFIGPADNENGDGLKPWSMSVGVPVRELDTGQPRGTAAIRTTAEALKEAGLGKAQLGLPKNSSFLTPAIAEGIMDALPDAKWSDASGLVDDCRIVQSPLELKCTRRAAELSDSMMLASIAAAGRGVNKREVMAAIYDAMFRRGGTYPGFVPLVRSTRTLSHEHGTWEDIKLKRDDLLFLEMAGCIRRYHAPMGRLVFIGKAPRRAERINGVCREAMHAAADRIAPGVKAGEVYEKWQEQLNNAGLSHYHRHHCGYSVGIGYPPSWSGGGVPVGLRAGSEMELQPGMVFHLMSWLLRTGAGDSFLSDTIVVTEKGCEFLTTVNREVTVR